MIFSKTVLADQGIKWLLSNLDGYQENLLDPTLKVIAQGGTAGLIVALILAVAILGKVLVRGSMVPRKDLEAANAKRDELEGLLFRLAGITERTVTASREFVQSTASKLEPGLQERLELIQQQLESLHDAADSERRKTRRPPHGDGVERG